MRYLTIRQVMARPVNTEKRPELVQQAIEVMRQEGMGISNTRLAEALGLKRPTLLYYFPERVAIFEQALADLLSEQALFVVARMMKHDHPIDQLYEQVRSVHAFHHEREHRVVYLTQALAAAGAERTSEIIEIGNRAFEMHRVALTARIRDGIAKKTIRPCDPEALIRICRAVIDGLMVQRVMTGCDLAPIHQLLWDGLLAPLKITPPGE